MSEAKPYMIDAETKTLHKGGTLIAEYVSYKSVGQMVVFYLNADCDASVSIRAENIQKLNSETYIPPLNSEPKKRGSARKPK